MDDDDIGIEKLRVDPALMQQILEQQARKSKRKRWQRICAVLQREWSCGCWKQSESAPTAWQSSCCTCAGTARANPTQLRKRVTSATFLRSRNLEDGRQFLAAV
jgi:hypothetical protein